MRPSETMLGLIKEYSQCGDMPTYVAHDFTMIAQDVAIVEKERDNCRVVTANEHLRVVQLYCELLVGKNEENCKLRELVNELWDFAYEYTSDPSELDRAKDMMRELGMEADDWA